MSQKYTPEYIKAKLADLREFELALRDARFAPNPESWAILYTVWKRE